MENQTIPNSDPQSEPVKFLIDDDDRYSRLRLIGWWDQEKLASAKVLVVGAGALGNEVMKNLALVGIGEIHVIDFDTIQHSNLSRSVLFRAEDSGKLKADVAAEFARRINPDCRITPINGDVMADVGLAFVQDVDVVICCVDNREARLWINRMCWKVGTPWIDGGIQEINGVVKLFTPPDGPCYECGMTEKDYQLIQLRYSCPLLKLEDMQQGKVPTAPTIASIVGGLQAQEALKVIHEIHGESGEAMVFNGVANQFYKTKYPFRDDCLSHECYEPILKMDLTNECTVEQLFASVSEATETQVEAIELDRDFLMTLTCRKCEVVDEVHQPRSSVNMSRAICSGCGDVMLAETIFEVTAGQMDDRKLHEIGVPDRDIVKIRANNEMYFVELAVSENG